MSRRTALLIVLAIAFLLICFAIVHVAFGEVLFDNFTFLPVVTGVEAGPTVTPNLTPTSTAINPMLTPTSTAINPMLTPTATPLTP